MVKITITPRQACQFGFILSLLLSSPAFSDDIDLYMQKAITEYNLCFEKEAKTQHELNLCAGNFFLKAEAELNRVYKLIHTAYKDDLEFLEKLKESQRIWIKLRDANIEMEFPPTYQSGSIYPMCFASSKATLTLQRVRYLKQWIDGTTIEGEVCSGSIDWHRAPIEGS